MGVFNALGLLTYRTSVEFHPHGHERIPGLRVNSDVRSDNGLRECVHDDRVTVTVSFENLQAEKLIYNRLPVKSFRT